MNPNNFTPEPSQEDKQLSLEAERFFNEHPEASYQDFREYKECRAEDERDIQHDR